MAGELRLLLEKGPLELPVQELCALGEAGPEAAARLALHCFFSSCIRAPTFKGCRKLWDFETLAYIRVLQA